MKLDIKLWLKFSLINLCIVALLGVLMRYKIGFEFPYFDQKNLQHSHSHFAFAGWITHTLMTLMIYFLQIRLTDLEVNKYKKTLLANLICSYGMLVFFIFQGYGLFSILFSTASIFVSYIFGYYFIQDLKKIESNHLSKNWFKAAILFSILSSLGTFSLAFMMISKNLNQDIYLSSIYYYLHFQYNGWFFFGCMGLLFGFLNLKRTDHSYYNTCFWLFFISCIPAYFLSILWLDLPLWLYTISIIAAAVQVFAWIKLVVIWTQTKKNLLNNLPVSLRNLIFFVGFALSIKLVLQLGSTIPFISKLAFGFRPIVIAYLHLVLLALFSLFLLFFLYAEKLFSFNKKTKIALLLFTSGVLLNEIVLATQGIASFSYTVIPYVNEILFAVALLLLLGISLTSYFSIKKEKKHTTL
jgi:hypothetical protein